MAPCERWSGDIIERCKDFRRIVRISDWLVNISPTCYYLMEVKNGKDLGVWGFHRYSDGLMVHVNMSADCRGKAAADSARNAFKWIFDNTDTKMIYALIPAVNRKTQVLAVFVGLSFIYNDKKGNRCYKLERGN